MNVFVFLVHALGVCMVLSEWIGVYLAQRLRALLQSQTDMDSSSGFISYNLASDTFIPELAMTNFLLLLFPGFFAF